MNQKYLISHMANGAMITNAVIVADHADRSLEAYRQLSEELGKWFPRIDPNSVECLTVTDSIYCKGCTAILATVDPCVEHDDWTSCMWANTDIRLG